MKKLFIISLCVCAFCTWNCSSKEKLAQEKDEISFDQSYPENLSLAQLLKRVPGVMVSGNGDNTSVRVRGGNTITGNPEPLFVVDGAVVGTSYANISQLNGHQVASIRVLKDAVSTSRYGMQGVNGVIVIRTKN